MPQPRRSFSVRAAVLAAASVVALMTVVGGMASWRVYARIESLLVSIADVQARSMALALRLSEASNRYAAGSGEIEAARDQPRRQAVMQALAQHARALHEAIAGLRHTPPTADGMPPIEEMVRALEENLNRQNELVERRIELDAQARRNRGELGALQLAFDRLALGLAAPATDDALHAAESAAGRTLLRLAELGQIDEVAALHDAQLDVIAAVARLRAALAALPADGGSEATGVLGRIDRLATGATGIFATRTGSLQVRAAIDAQAAATRQVVTHLGTAVTGLVNAVEAESEQTRRAVEAEIETGRHWLFLVALFTFLGPVALVWLAVGRLLARPLTRLAEATRRIADGDLLANIPATRFRELQAIADAVAVFRDNTGALADRTMALLRSEEAQRQARRQAETALADLRETQEQLIQSEKMSALGSLVAGVAHEINTPIGITVTASTLLEEEVAAMQGKAASGALKRSDLQQFLERARETAGLMHANMQRAADLIQAFKQVSADQSNDQRRTFDLRDTLDQTLISLRPATQKAGHAVLLDCPEDLDVDAQPGAVSQVVTILVMNALDHAFAEGSHGCIAVSGRRDGAGAVCIEVADDGRGIPADLQRRVFEPFFTTRRADGNTGLGLHIAFNIVRQTLKGRLDLSSGPGGTRFTIRMPLRPPEDGAGEQPAAPLRA